MGDYSHDTQTQGVPLPFFRTGETPNTTTEIEEYYRMNHKDRGIALIFTHEHFTKKDLPLRIGTEVDQKSLSKVLNDMEFEVREYNDLDFEGIEAALQEAAEFDHSHSDCFVVAVFSHGDENIICAKDKGYKPEVLWEKFSGDKCKSLVGKPKLFFIQACKGFQVDGGVELRMQTEIDSSCSRWSIPIHADFLVAYSTVPGYLSWANLGQGSWFIQTLCEVLAKYKYEKDLLHILTLVMQKVAFGFQSECPDDMELHQKKQMPHFVSMLTRLVAFKPK